jgi:ADP-heptose:LPS heptosyltransferase
MLQSLSIQNILDNYPTNYYIMRILVVRIGRAGDIVMTTAALNALFQCYPSAEFTLLTSPDGNRLLKQYNPLINDIWVWNRSSLTASLQKNKLKSKIKNARFEKIFCFETNTSIAKLFNNSGAKLYQPEPGAEIVHSARLYLNMVKKSCNTEIDQHYANLPVTNSAISKVDHELQNIGINKNDIIIAIHPTFSGFSRFPFIKSKTRKNKLWPAERFAELGTKLSKYTLNNGKHPVIIIDLLESEAALGKTIVKLSSGNIKLLTEPANMERYKALLKRVDILVSPDTGPMHIAAAVNTRIVALFSGKSPADCGPYMPGDRFTTIHAENMPDPSQGITAISVNEVYDACLQQLDAINEHMEINQ